MKRFCRELHASLDRLDAESMRRRLRPLPDTGPRIDRAGATLVNLASNDYLGLAHHPALKQAAIDAINQLGTGATASRLTTGHLDLHQRIERQFAAFKHAPGALLLPTGYMANLAALTALAGPGDLVCLDKLNHASLIDAARASGATVRTFPHRQYEKLERLLARRKSSEARGQRSEVGGQESQVGGDEAGIEELKSAIPNRRSAIGNAFIVTDSVFSMDGDVADLAAICELADRYDAVVIVDEAHATGVLGERGAGLCEAQGVAGRVDVVVSTASKALGGLGGIVTAATPVIDTLINRARSAIYTTAVPPGQAAAIGAAVDVVHDEPWRRERVLALSHRVRDALRDAGWDLPTTEPVTPIFPLVVGGAARALDLAAHLQREGVLAVAVRPPTVAPGASRVRVSLRADLEDADVDLFLDALKRWPNQNAPEKLRKR